MNPPKNWRSFGRCLDEDPELHFPVGNTGPALLQAEQAKAVCRRCIVRETCLETEMTAEGSSGRDSRYGIRGGHTPAERFALYKRTVKQRNNQRRQQQAAAA